MERKPELKFWQIWNMCFGFMGIQMGFALQNANVSRIFQSLGAEIEDIPILWIAAPVTGLVVQPIIGYLSDGTWNSLGRRRPFFLAGAILASLSLLIMPNSPVLWIAAGMLWIMDASLNVCMEPFRALVGDMLPKRQRTMGFATQSFFIGVGAVVASALPWMMSNWFGISNTAAAGEIPDSVRLAFYIGGAALFLAVGWTILRTREYPPERLAAFAASEGAAGGSAAGGGVPGEGMAGGSAAGGGAAGGVVSGEGMAGGSAVDGGAAGGGVPGEGGEGGGGDGRGGDGAAGATLAHRGISEGIAASGGERVAGGAPEKPTAGLMPAEFTASGALWTAAGVALAALVFASGLAAELYVLAAGMAFFGAMQLLCRGLARRGATDSGFYQVFALIKRMPLTMKQLAVVQFLSWFALFALWIYSTPAVTAHHFGSSDTTSAAYNNGADWVGVLFASYNLFAALAAFFVAWLANRIGRRQSHLVNMLLGGAGMASMAWIANPDYLVLSMVGIGIAWASILSLPYALLSTALPAAHMGVYMGIFNFFIVIPQILAATVLGLLVRVFFGGEAILALVLGGLLMALAGIATLFVSEPE